jgi:DNA-directed RNA polymerase subunit RPC12/RpoP
MAELGNVNPVTRASCPDCGTLLDDATLALFADEDVVSCPNCAGRIKLPDAMVQKIRVSRYTGRNLDITA